MKTFLQQFDTVEVPDYDVFHSGCLETDVVENIHTIDELLKEHQMILVNNQHQMVGENVRIITAVRNYYVVLGEDGYKLFRRDGVLLADQIRGFYVFHAGWIMVSFDDTVSLYRDDATLAYQDADDMMVVVDGEAFAAQDKCDNWKVFTAKGELLAENVDEFKFYSSKFFALKFADNPKTVIFDCENNLQLEVDAELCHIHLQGHQMFTVKGVDREMLYSSQGTRFEPKYKTYQVFDNGLILAETFKCGYMLLNQKFEILLLQVEKISYNPCFSELMLVSGSSGDFIFDAKGELIYKASAYTLRLAGKDCFLRKNADSRKSELLRHDLTVLDDDCVRAYVYPNGWMRLVKKDAQFKDRLYLELRQPQNEKVVTDAQWITYFPQWGAYIVRRGKRFFLYDAKGHEVVSDADDISVYVDLYVVKRNNQPMEVGLLANLA